MSSATIAAIGAIATLAVNGVASAFAGWRWWQVRPSAAVWPLLRAGQVGEVGAQRGQLLPAYLHSKAPLRQT